MGIISSQQADSSTSIHQNTRRPTQNLPSTTLTNSCCRCVICKEDIDRPLGFFCENHHFVCTVGSCFDNYARAASEPDASRRSFDNEGNLLCPVCVNAQVKYILPPGIESIIQLKVNLLTARALAVQEQKMRSEITRLQSIEV